MLWDIHSTCRLCHAVYGFIFIEHLRVVLFFHLDICQKFAHIGIPECKHIGIIRSGHHFFGTDTVRGKEIVVFLVFPILECHYMSSVWRVIWMQGLICRQTFQMRNNLLLFFV